MNRANVFEHESKPGTVGELLDNLPAPASKQLSTTTRAVPPAITPMQMIQIALDRGADLDMMSKLMDLQDRWEANEARKAYVSALSAFKADPPTIIKNKHVGFDTRSGDTTQYKHATLDQVCNAVAPALSANGLSHRWSIEQGDGMIRVTCVLTHVLGHSEKVTLSAGADQSGKKNPIQAIASTVTYLQRYTLLAATGLAAADQDNDGAGGGIEMISAEQKDELIAFMKETGADVRKFLDYLDVPTLDELPAARFAGAKAALAKKKEKKS